MLNRKIDIKISFVYFLIATIYILVFRVFLFEHPVQPVIKTIPIWILLIVACWRMPKYKGGILLCIGILFASLGDYVLSMPQLEKGFILGLGLFLVGHIFYATAFLRSFKYRISRFIPLVFVLLGILILLNILLPKLPSDLKIPILSYMAVILLMNITAAFRKYSYPAVIFGAIIFMVSDSIIALRKFANMDIWDPWVMITYYVAQFLIVYGSIADAEIEAVSHN